MMTWVRMLGNCLDDGHYDRRVLFEKNTQVYALFVRHKPVVALSVMRGSFHECKARFNDRNPKYQSSRYTRQCAACEPPTSPAAPCR